MVEQETRKKLLILESIAAVILLLFITSITLNKFFPTPTVEYNQGTDKIVGFVAVSIENQPIDIQSSESRAFVLASEKDQFFNLTSLRMSGEVKGNGRAEITLENGAGQELLIFSNVKKKQGNMITGLAVSEGSPLPEDVKINQQDPATAWIKIIQNEQLAKESPTKILDDTRQAVEGNFKDNCIDTCYMNVKMQKGLTYALKVKLDPGTEIKINELKYTLDV